MSSFLPADSNELIKTTSTNNTRTTNADGIARTFKSDDQAQMLQAFEEEADYHVLIDKMMDIEKQRAPEPGVSTLLHRDGARADAAALLLQLRHEDLKHILNNTLPQAWDHGTSEHMAEPETTGVGLEPIVHVSYVVGDDGLGVPVDKLLALLELLKLAMEIEGQAQVDGKAYTTATVRSAIDATYQNLPHHKDQESMPSFFTHGARDLGHLKSQVEDFVAYYRNEVHPAATANKDDYIQFPGHVGMSDKGYSRCKVDLQLEPESPHLFRLVHLTLRAFWPARKWRLRQVYLFHLQKASQAEIGATIGSIMCGPSYPRTGGFDFQQPGLNQHDIDAMTDDDWGTVHVAGYANPKSGWVVGEENMVEWNRSLQAKLDKIRNESACVRKRKLAQERKQEYDREHEAFTRETKALDDQFVSLQETIAKMDEPIKKLKAQKEAVQAVEDLAKTLEEITSGLEGFQSDEDP